MKYFIFGFVLLTLLFGGCDETTISNQKPSALNAWMVQTADDEAIRNAIVRQSTLFPYQFVESCAELNSLGQRDAAVLADHFKTCPGNLKIRRGAESDELYGKRVEYVVGLLGKSGVPAGQISVGDLPAGGDSMPSELVILILQANAESYKNRQTTKTYTSGNMSILGGAK